LEILSTAVVTSFGQVATGVADYDRVDLSFLQCIRRSSWCCEGEWREEVEEEDKIEEACHF